VRLKASWLMRRMKITRLRHAAAEIGLRQLKGLVQAWEVMA
jgi:hypothetical protein